MREEVGARALQRVTEVRANLNRIAHRTGRNVFRDQPIKPHVDAIEAVCGNTDGMIAYNRFSNVRGLVVTPGDNTPGVPQDRFTIVNNLFAKTRTFAFNGVVMRMTLLAMVLGAME